MNACYNWNGLATLELLLFLMLMGPQPKYVLHSLKIICYLNIYEFFIGMFQTQFCLSEVTCVVCCSEPGNPRLAIHTPNLSQQPLKLQFAGDTDMEEWMANLTSGTILNF